MIVSIEGSVDVLPAGATAPQPAATGGSLCPQDVLTVNALGRAALALADGTVLRLDQNTSLQVQAAAPQEPSLLDLARGAIELLSRNPMRLDVRTPFVNAAVEGTEFLVAVAADQATVVVFEGRVTAANEQGSVTLTANEAATARAGAAPQRDILVRPRDAAQWTLHVPPVIVVLASSETPAPADLPPALAEAIELQRRGDLPAAIDRLQPTGDARTDSRLLAYRAGLLLSVGRIDMAQGDLDRSLALAPANAEALALRSVIAVAHNDSAAALNDSAQALALAPDSAPAAIARSYALQAAFRIEEARDVMRDAVERNPDDALAWARLAELHLALGDGGAAGRAADRAADLAPDLGRTQTVRGFTALARFDTAGAQAAFARAADLAPSDPLPRLGLGLALIRTGALAEGRHQIELAAALDPENALVRSYLGRAYFAERRDTRAATQFDIATALDPNDPTPWLYDALLLQTANRPVAALRSLERSIALNDNRAVYRSRLLLDEDLAVRGASLGRLYQTLGFDQLGLAEGLSAVTTAPGNPAAHRFLADTYAALPRHEIGRTSELLQSQLRQPLGLAALQPQLQEENLFILEGTGPSDVALNEYSPLFLRDGFSLQANGVIGGNDTFGNDLVVSGVAGRFAASLGQFHYQTDGFRPNNDQEDDIVSLFAQAALTEDTAVQAEIRRREFERGDLPLRFSPEAVFPNLRQDDDTTEARLGFRHDFSPRSQAIANLQFADIESEAVLAGSATLVRDEQQYGAEAQHVFDIAQITLITGAGYGRLEFTDRATVFLPVPLPVISTETEGSLNHGNAYVYGIADLGALDLTIGLDAAFIDGDGDGDDSNEEQLNPKLGVAWSPWPTTTLRAAVFRTLTRPFAAGQTIEPTQVSGFNQFFSDFRGTSAWQYGTAIDQDLSPVFGLPAYAGASFSVRDLEVPGAINFPAPAPIVEDWDEQLFRAYLYVAPAERWALSAEYLQENFDRGLGLVGRDLFTELDTYRYRLGATYFHPSGFSLGVTGTLVDQDGIFAEVAAPADPDTGLPPTTAGDDRFFVLDAALSYRLPGRRGSVALVGRNLLDADFRFQDTDPASPRITPDRQIVLRASLFF